MLNGRTRIRYSLNQSRAATCRDFACGVREIGGYFGRSRKTVARNWLKHSQSESRLSSNHHDEAESLLSGRLNCDRAMDIAHRPRSSCAQPEERARELEGGAKAAQDRARAFEADANHFRDHAARAEEWLVRIHSEVEQTLFQKTSVNGRARSSKHK
jgi:hypothetical protein